MDIFTRCLLVGLLVGGLVLGSALALSARRSESHPFNFRSLTLWMYTAIHFLSGLVHLTGLSAGDTGHYSAMGRGAQSAQTISVAVGLSLLGLLALGVGTLTGRRVDACNNSSNAHPRLMPEERRTMWVVGTSLLLLSLPALATLHDYTNSLNSIRVASLDGGLARVGFLATWFAWAVTFISVAIDSKLRPGADVARALVLLLSVGVIAAGVSWTGGRSIAVIMALPLLLTLFPKLTKLRKRILLILMAAITVRIVQLTTARTAYTGPGEFNLWSVLDWQWGRFSMNAFADVYVRNHGFLYGETLLAGALYVPNAILHFLGQPYQAAHMREVTEITGTTLLGDPKSTYIVPGMLAELHMNFGPIGIALGFYLLGLAAARVDDAYRSTSSTLVRVGAGYLGTLLAFQTIAAQSGAILSYVAFTGLPAIAAMGISSFYHRRSPALHETSGTAANERGSPAV